MICRCGKETRNPKYCSHACANTGTGPARTRRASVQCRQCGVSFEVLRNAIEKRVYCSRECSHESNRLHRACPQCGKRFSGRRKKKHCSLACSRKPLRKGVGGTARWTDSEYRRNYMAQYASANRERMNAQRREYKRANRPAFSERQRRRRVAGQSIGTYLRLQRAVVAAVGRCLGCGSLERLELDHVEPIAAGGLDAPENYQVLCRRCNAAKGSHTRDYRDETVKGLIMAAVHGIDVEIVRRSKARGWR